MERAAWWILGMESAMCLECPKWCKVTCRVKCIFFCDNHFKVAYVSRVGCKHSKVDNAWSLYMLKWKWLLKYISTLNIVGKKMRIIVGTYWSPKPSKLCWQKKNSEKSTYCRRWCDRWYWTSNCQRNYFDLIKLTLIDGFLQRCLMMTSNL